MRVTLSQYGNRLMSSRPRSRTRSSAVRPGGSGDYLVSGGLLLTLSQSALAVAKRKPP